MIGVALSEARKVSLTRKKWLVNGEQCPRQEVPENTPLSVSVLSLNSHPIFRCFLALRVSVFRNEFVELQILVVHLCIM